MAGRVVGGLAGGREVGEGVVGRVVSEVVVELAGGSAAGESVVGHLGTRGVGVRRWASIAARN